MDFEPIIADVSDISLWIFSRKQINWMANGREVRVTPKCDRERERVTEWVNKGNRTKWEVLKNEWEIFHAPPSPSRASWDASNGKLITMLYSVSYHSLIQNKWIWWWLLYHIWCVVRLSLPQCQYRVISTVKRFWNNKIEIDIWIGWGTTTIFFARSLLLEMLKFTHRIKKFFFFLWSFISMVCKFTKS